MRAWAAPLALGLLVAAAAVFAPRERDAAGGMGDRAEEAARSLGGAEGETASGVLGSAEERSYESPLSLEGEGARLVEEYGARGDCVMAQAGYLDLSGSVWGCVMQGGGWVDICVVRDVEGGKGSCVVVWHMDADAAEEALAGP